MNPCTLGWYLPLLVADVPGALQPSDGDRAGAGAGTGPGRPSADAHGHAMPAGGEADASAAAPARDAGGSAWKELDAKFRRDLPDEAYVGRLVYRGLVMRACPAIRLLDGVEVSGKEREKAERVLKGVLGMRRGRVAGPEAEARG
ncbi:hypothetical protein IEO21_09440 [Rhodonia placenta]|uniref:Uncharacterized protein n=2 Tax=Rhodonia placenta TaxID=104341 RepID=A0A1X6MJD8_9APHY|nr:hypothetical protein POSPLADRAFT_1041963 [Postia placenta MAD-698-R-SB12]KAF9804277.1 hypothetical protein IEO21_09440 [Postia placenta]OSX56458.1 hypothetical protein POSPLADRAFT_1041963 [Postia placenta MAD-698-R-SB12]